MASPSDRGQSLIEAVFVVALFAAMLLMFHSIFKTGDQVLEKAVLSRRLK